MGVRIQLSLIEYSFDNFCLWCNAQRGKFWIIEEIIDFWYPGFTREHKHKGSISVQLIYSLLFLDSVYVELASALVVWSNPNQSNRRSAVQWYFPPMVSVLWLNPFVFFHLFIYFTVWPSFSHISSKNLRVKYDTPLSTIKQAITYISWSSHCANVLEKKTRRLSRVLSSSRRLFKHIVSMFLHNEQLLYDGSASTAIMILSFGPFPASFFFIFVFSTVNNKFVHYNFFPVQD